MVCQSFRADERVLDILSVKLLNRNPPKFHSSRFDLFDVDGGEGSHPRKLAFYRRQNCFNRNRWYPPPIFISSTKTPLKYDCLKQLISVLQIKLPKLQAICKLLIIYLFLVISYEQCDQIGRFLKVLGDIVSIKSSPNAWWIFGIKC